ncbi:efflux RND transporter periplasmic adaptor subunit [Sphingobacterium sp. Mn56C]|uniref:efflux RND transporter periplasmic adaptor subunit n=1 Tax=Sphingobacterium sp. Mn56C TaxID=3395261 RepID=UPI003BBB8693
MKQYIKMLTLAILLGGFIGFTSCNSNRNTESEETKTEQDHEHEEEAGGTIASLTEEQIQAVGIRLGSIEQKNLTETIKANGELQVPNNNKANATSMYGGVVKTLLVQLGDFVKKGQVIATIENPQFIQLQEEYLTLQSQVVLAEQELARQEELHEGNAGAKRNLQNATASLSALRTRKASLQQQIKLMGINPNAVTAGNLKNALVVSSPISGAVSNVFAKIGSYVDVSSPVLEIVDNSLLHLDLHVFEKDLPKISIGQAINFTITNNPTTSYTATVFSIGSSFENDSKTVAVHCSVQGNKVGLIDGMNITGTISLGNVLQTAVPSSALVEADGKFYIYMLTDKTTEDKEHKHQEGEVHDPVQEEKNNTRNFEKIEVAKGVTDLGYTAITPVVALPKDAKIAVKGAFFIHAKLSNTGGHDH